MRLFAMFMILMCVTTNVFADFIFFEEDDIMQKRNTTAKPRPKFGKGIFPPARSRSKR